MAKAAISQAWTIVSVVQYGLVVKNTVSHAQISEGVDTVSKPFPKYSEGLKGE